MSFAFNEPVVRRAAAGCGLLLAGALASGCPSTGDSGSGASGTTSGTTTGTTTGSGGTGGGTSTTSTTSTTTTTTGTGGSGGTTGSGGSAGSGGTTGSGGSTGSGGAGGNGGSGGSPCDPALCNDGNACTTDSCVNGACAHAALNPDDGDACTTDACDPLTGVSHTPMSCDDANVCTTDSCVGGACAHAALSPDDGNACTTDACDPVTGVSHTPLSCDDGNVCTGDSCNPASGCASVPLIYFLETFADNSKGWALEPSWQIGPEIADPTIPPAPLSNPDPALDHTATNDNGVAGVYIGGVTTQAAHAAYHLTSPVIDLSGVSTPVHLEFWRYLNSDDPAVMKSSVEVYDGAAWKEIYANPAQVKDAAWVKKQYDVSAYKNANFRVRWGWSVSPGGAFICSQWNVDDVRLIPDPACP